MKVNRAHEHHRVEARSQNFRKHGADESAPAPGLPEYEVDAGGAAVGEPADRVESLGRSVILENFLKDDVVEGVGRGQQVSEVGHRVGRSAIAHSIASPHESMSNQIHGRNPGARASQAPRKQSTAAAGVQHAPALDGTESFEQGGIRVATPQNGVLFPVGSRGLAFDTTPDVTGLSCVDVAEASGEILAHDARREGTWMERTRRTFAGAAFAVLAVLLAGCADGPPPTPEQPFAFSHQAHAADDIECTRCHVGVETQNQAGLPPMATCAGCHRRQAADHPVVMAFMEQYAAGEPVVWQKVNTIPESAMVHFKHAPHVQANVDCATCHGDVEQMTVAEAPLQVADMGWCVDCHREQEASIDCLTCHH